MKAAIIYIMGVSGSGKTTIGKKLAEKIRTPFFDGDDFHPASNKKKMKSGIPLTDEDREGWLIAINEKAKEQQEKDGAIFACSALKEKYRSVLSEGISAPLYWIFLQGSFDLIKKRIQERKGHFMPPSLLASQFDDLEIPEHAITVDISKPPDEMVESIFTEIKKQF
jgi:gluconokinase